MEISRDGHEQDQKYQQHLNTSLNPTKAGFPSPEAKAQRTTADVLHGTQNEPLKRVVDATHAYETREQGKPLQELSPSQQYQVRLGKWCHGYDKRQIAHQSHEALMVADRKIGTTMIASGGVNKAQLAQTLEQHSPAAAKLPPQERQQYCQQMAEVCDRRVNISNERGDKDKTKSQQYREDDHKNDKDFEIMMSLYSKNIERC